MEGREMSVMRSKSARFQHGVSIVEALVALLVLSIGMLGIAVMYLESVRANRTALSRTQAIHLINDMADRIRSNRGARGAYALALTDTKPTGAADCAGANCTPDALAKYDIQAWATSVIDTLPKGADGGTLPKVRITYAAGASSKDPARYTIFAQWKDAGSEDLLSAELEFTQIGTT
jgi:type IV pilus assembly protein PilV